MLHIIFLKIDLNAPGFFTASLFPICCYWNYFLNLFCWMAAEVVQILVFAIDAQGYLLNNKWMSET